MLQESGVPDTLKVREVAELFRRLYPRPMEVRAALHIAQLEDKANALVATLSGGQKQRLYFALAVVGNPDVLFLDEPTVSLDVEARRAFWEQIEGMVGAGKTIVLTTHYLEEADALADRIVVINHGQIVAEGTPSEIKAKVGAKRVRFSRDRSGRCTSAAAARRSTGSARRGYGRGVHAAAGSTPGDAVRGGPGDPGARSRRRRSGRCVPVAHRPHGVEPVTVDNRSHRQPQHSATGVPISALAYIIRCEVIKLLRIPAFTIPTLLFPIMFFAFFGLPNIGETIDGFDAGPYIMASYGAYVVISVALFSFGVSIAAERGLGWNKLLRTTPMHPLTYFVAKIAMAIITGLLTLVGLFAFAIIAGGVSLGLLVWAKLVGALVLGMIPFVALGLCIGYVAGPNSAAAIANVIFLPFSFASGLFVPLAFMPSVHPEDRAVPAGLPHRPACLDHDRRGRR